MPGVRWISPRVRRPVRREGAKSVSVLVRVLVEGNGLPKQETNGAYWFNHREWSTDLGRFADAHVIGWHEIGV